MKISTETVYYTSDGKRYTTKHDCAVGEALRYVKSEGALDFVADWLGPVARDSRFPEFVRRYTEALEALDKLQ